MRNKNRIIKRIVAALFGLPFLVGGFMLIINQATGKGIDLDQEKWSVNFIPGELLVIILAGIPMFIGVALLFYAITGKAMSN